MNAMQAIMISLILKEMISYFTFGLRKLRVRAEHAAIRRIGCSF